MNVINPNGDIKRNLNSLIQKYNKVCQQMFMLIQYIDILSQNPGLTSNMCYLAYVQAQTVSQINGGVKQQLLQHLLESYELTESIYQKFALIRVIQVIQERDEQWIRETLEINSFQDVQKFVLAAQSSFDKLDLENGNVAINFLTNAQNIFKINVQLSKCKPNAHLLQQLITLIDEHICIFNMRPTEGNFVCMYNNAQGTFTIQSVEQQLLTLNKEDVFSIVNLTTFSDCKKDSINSYPAKMSHVVYFGSFFHKNNIQIEQPEYLTVASLFNCQYISLAPCRYLKKIILQYVTTVDVSDFKKMHYLEHLYVNTCGMVHKYPEESLLMALQQSPRLQTIEIYNFWFPAVQIIDFPLKELKVLVIYGIGLNVIKIYTKQAQMMNLQLLSIGNTEISSDMEVNFEFYGEFNFEQLYFVQCKNKEEIKTLIGAQKVSSEKLVNYLKR